MDGTRRVVWPVLLSIAAGVIAPGCKQVEVIPAPGHGLGTVVERTASAGSTLERADDETVVSTGAGRPGPSTSGSGIPGTGAGAPRRPSRLRAVPGPGGAGRPERAGDGPIGDGRGVDMVTRRGRLRRVLPVEHQEEARGADATWCAARRAQPRRRAVPATGSHHGRPRTERMARSTRRGRDRHRLGRTRVDVDGIDVARAGRGPDRHRIGAAGAPRRPRGPVDRASQLRRLRDRRVGAVRTPEGDVRRDGRDPASSDRRRPGANSPSSWCSSTRPAPTKSTWAGESSRWPPT